MPNLLPHAKLVQDFAFRSRVRAATVQAAVGVSGESGDAVPTPRSVLRQALAGRVLSVDATTDSLWESVTWAVAADTGVLATYVSGIGGVGGDGDQGMIPDADLETVIAGIWDDLSGAAQIPPYNAFPAP